MYEPQRALAGSNALFIDQRQDRAPNRGRQRSSAHEPPRAVRINNLSISHSAHIRIRASAEIEDTAGGVTEITIGDEVIVPVKTQAISHLLKVGRDSISLIARDGEDIGESTTARETQSGNFVERLARCRRRGIAEGIPLRAANGENVGARAGEVDREDLPGLAVAEVLANTGVAGGHDDGGALESELHPFVALSFYVVVRPSGLVCPVGDGDDVCGLVHAALKLARVAAGVEVWIRWVETFGLGAIAGLAIGAVGAIAAVDGIKEGLRVLAYLTWAAQEMWLTVPEPVEVSS